MLRKLALIGVGIALSVGIGASFHLGSTSALFSTQSTNPTNTFQAGTLRISNSRDGRALFTASTGVDGPAVPGTLVTVATGTVAVGGLGAVTTASGTMPVVLGANGPLSATQSVSGTGGMAPGTILVNSVTIGNVGTLSAGSVVLSVPSASVANWPAASCDGSTALIVDGADACGRGRLSDVLRLTAWYPTADGRAVCVLGASRGTIVPATSDSQAYLGCAGPSGLGDSLTMSDSSAVLPLAPLGASDGQRLTIPGAATSGPRVVPLLTQGVAVKNFRGGVLVNDWDAGQTRAITFAVAFDPLADNRYAGAQASIDLRWNTVSLTGAPASSGSSSAP